MIQIKIQVMMMHNLIVINELLNQNGMNDDDNDNDEVTTELKRDSDVDTDDEYNGGNGKDAA